RQLKILLDIETCKDGALLRADRDAGAGDDVRREADELAVPKPHRSGAFDDHPHDGLECRGLACAVAAEQCDDLAGIDLETHAMKHMGLAVPGLQVADRKEGTGAVSGHIEPLLDPSWPGLTRPRRLFLRCASMFDVPGTSPATTLAGGSRRSRPDLTMPHAHVS